MGLIQIVKSWFKPKDTWAVDDDRWYSAIWPQETKSGAKVDETRALSVSAVWACIRILSEDIGSLPLHLYTRARGGKERAVNHPLYRLLHDRPNPEMSAMSFRETMASHLLAWGNCYAEKETDFTGGRVKALWPIPPNKVEIYRDRDTQEIYYKVQVNESGKQKTLLRDQMFHVPGLSSNGIFGYSPIGKMREAVGMASALEEFGARFFGQGTTPGLIISHPGKLGDQAHQNLKESLGTAYSGLGKTHRLMLLEEGMKPEKSGFLLMKPNLLSQNGFNWRKSPEFTGCLFASSRSMTGAWRLPQLNSFHLITWSTPSPRGWCGSSRLTTGNC